MKITKVRAILTAPDGIALVIVKVETDQDGLYGVGCATFTQRPTLVAKAVEDYLDPLLQGQDPRNSEDLAYDVCQLLLAQRPGAGTTRSAAWIRRCGILRARSPICL